MSKWAITGDAGDYVNSIEDRVLDLACEIARDAGSISEHHPGLPLIRLEHVQAATKKLLSEDK